MNSGCKLHADIVILLMDNMYSTIGKNIDILCININLAPMIVIGHFLF